MTEFDVLQHFPAVELPPESPGGQRLPAVADLIPLLQKNHALQARLNDHQQALDQAVDAVWASVAMLFHQLIQTGRAGEQPDGAGRVPQLIQTFCENHQLEFQEPTGQFADQLSPGTFEILSTIDTEIATEQHRVVETYEPAVLRRGRLIRTGKIVVARHLTPSAEGESP